jgi:hypothetical protein
MAESSLDFFVLPKPDAIAVVEYWHHLRGLRGFLNSCPSTALSEKPDWTLRE